MTKEKKAKSKTKKKVSNKETISTLPSCGLAEDVLAPVSSEDKGSAENSKKTPAYTKERSEDTLLDENQMKFVTFFLDKEEYGVPITHVQEINRVVEITRLPNTPEHVKGVINLRGKIIPVIELKRWLQIGETKMDRHSRIVLVEDGSKLLGLIVDKVAQVINIPFEQIEETPAEVTSVSKNFVRGIGKVEDRMIIILELDKVVQEKKYEVA